MKSFFCRITPILMLAFSLGRAQAQEQPPAFTWDKNAKVSHAETITGQSVTIQLKIADPARQMKLLRNGLEIWLDPKGKKNKNTGIKYPLPASGARSMGGSVGQSQQSGSQQRPTSQDSINRNRRIQIEAMLQESKQLEFVGFRDNLNGKHDLSFASGVTVQLSFGEKDTLEYLVRIPFDALAAAVDPSKAISVGIVLKGMQLPDFGGGGFGEGGEMGPPPGGPPPGGMGGDGPPNMEDIQELFAENVIWVKLKPTK